MDAKALCVSNEVSQPLGGSAFRASDALNQDKKMLMDVQYLCTSAALLPGFAIHESETLPNKFPPSNSEILLNNLLNSI